MASTLKFDSERREMRRERHEARVARKRERQQARQLKHAQQGDAVRVPVVAIERPAPAPLVETAPTAPVSAAEVVTGAGAAVAGDSRVGCRGVQAVRGSARTRRHGVPRAP